MFVHIDIWKEGKWYVAKCLNFPVTSQGETEEKALSNVQEALEIYLEDPDVQKEIIRQAIQPKLNKIKVAMTVREVQSDSFQIIPIQVFSDDKTSPSFRSSSCEDTMQ